MHPDPHILDDLVQRIVEVAHPRQIILFGSAARGEMGPQSDLDVLVVVPDGTHCRHTAQTIYQHLIGLGVAVDVVVATTVICSSTVRTSVWCITPPCARVGPFMPLEPPTPGSPEDWLRHARSDLALAQQWQVPDVLLAALCFHAQQTVEKSLKAVLVQRADYSSRDVSYHGDDVLAAPAETALAQVEAQ